MGAIISLLANHLHIWCPALPASNGFGMDLKKNAPTVMGSDAPPLYEAALVGDWATVTSRCEDQPETASFVDGSGNTALHVACRRNPPPDVVGALITSYPDALTTRTSDGLTPLHFACYFSADGRVVEMILQELEDRIDLVGTAGTAPEGLRPGSETVQRSSSGSSPYMGVLLGVLTLGIYRNKTQSGDERTALQTDGLLSSTSTPESLLPPDRRKRTPLHCSCAGPRSSNRPEVVRLLLLSATNPAHVVLQKDGQSRTTLHLIVDDYSEEIEDALRDGTDIAEVADSCLVEGGILHECWAIMTLLLVTCSYSNSTAAKEWLGKGSDIYRGQETIQAVHAACKSVGDACPSQFTRLARRIVHANIDRSRVGKVSDLRAQWESKAKRGLDIV